MLSSTTQVRERRQNHPRNSKVQFADYDRVTPVRKVSSFSRPNVWFVDNEFGAFYDETMKTVERMEQGKALRDRKYTATGLENFTEEGRALKVAFREDAYDAVLSQGDYAYQRGRRGSFLLAHAYQLVAEGAQQIAVIRAQQLRNDVVPYLICDSPSTSSKKGNKNKKKKQQKKQKHPAQRE